MNENLIRKKKRTNGNDFFRVCFLGNGLRYFLLFFFVAFLFGGITLLIYFNYFVVDYKVYDFDYYVGNHSGFNLDDDGVIHFGTVFSGVEVRREIEISSAEDVIVEVYIDSEGGEGENGDGGEIIIEKNGFLLNAGKKVRIGFFLRVSDEIEEDYYKGKVKILFRRP